MKTYWTIEKSGKLTYIEFKIRFLRKNASTAHSDAASGNVKMNEEVKKKKKKKNRKFSLTGSALVRRRGGAGRL